MDLPYRENVCLLIYNSDFKLFLGERTNLEGAWQFPQGGVEDGFTLEENVIKEASEETGADENLFKITAKLLLTNKYDFVSPPEYFKDKFRGQDQTFWLVQFLGNDSNIDLNKHIPEFRNYQWCSVEEVKRMASPLRLPAYIKALDEACQLIDLKRL